MSNQIRTLIQDERTLGPNLKVRGARHWSAAEVLSSTWFFVESCVEGEGSIQRWVTTSILEATKIKRALEPSTWARIFICIRAPKSIREATLFEEIDKAYLVGASGMQIFELANGLSYVLGAESTRDTRSTEAKEMRLLYNRKGIQ
jgi:hypothetical protein